MSEAENGTKILPAHDSIQCLADDFALFFQEKADKIQNCLNRKITSWL